jgi:hypothetical protein
VNTATAATNRRSLAAPAHAGWRTLPIGYRELVFTWVEDRRALGAVKGCPGGKSPIYVNPNMVAAGAIFLLGFILLVVVVMNVNLF